jgi:alginate O-acetyltransferase complex protein AlgI
MVFSSIDFLFVFLPAFLLVQTFLPCRNLSYVLFSLAFYFVGEGYYSLIVVLSVMVNYALGLAIDAQPTERRRKLLLALGVSLNLLSLFTFKYATFFLGALTVAPDAVAGAHGWHLPLGISFFTFHAISYLVDIYRRDALAERSFVNLSLYMLMFPQLIAGPILRFHTIARQLARRVVTARHVYFGFLLLCLGLGQKILLADTLAGVADALFAQSDALSSRAAWLAVLAYSLQIFFDFAGYSNMAIGLGWMTGFDLPKNFDYPYASQSITEFWRRWHMSLSRWFRDYLYIPLGGNRLGPVRTYVNLLIVFLLCGLWHGAAWTFVLWGAYHGLWLVLERIGGERLLQSLPRPLRHLYALLVVMVGWTLFRADSLAQAGNLLSKMFWIRSATELELGQTIGPAERAAFVLAIAFSTPALPRLAKRWLCVVTEQPLPRHVGARAYVYGTLVGVLVFSAVTTKVLTGSYSPFIYFRF